MRASNGRKISYLVRLKVEMEAINHVAMDYHDESDRFLKS